MEGAWLLKGVRRTVHVRVDVMGGGGEDVEG